MGLLSISDVDTDDGLSKRGWTADVLLGLLSMSDVETDGLENAAVRSTDCFFKSFKLMRIFDRLLGAQYLMASFSSSENEKKK